MATVTKLCKFDGGIVGKAGSCFNSYFTAPLFSSTATPKPLRNEIIENFMEISEVVKSPHWTKGAKQKSL